MDWRPVSGSAPLRPRNGQGDAHLSRLEDGHRRADDGRSPRRADELVLPLLGISHLASRRSADCPGWLDWLARLALDSQTLAHFILHK